MNIIIAMKAINVESDFINTLHCRGVGAMEIVAMDMKLRGMYIARQLSFHGVSFKIEDVPLNKEFIQMYDDSVKLVSIGLFLEVFWI